MSQLTTNDETSSSSLEKDSSLSSASASPFSSASASPVSSASASNEDKLDAPLLVKLRLFRQPLVYFALVVTASHAFAYYAVLSFLTVFLSDTVLVGLEDPFRLISILYALVNIFYATGTYSLTIVVPDSPYFILQFSMPACVFVVPSACAQEVHHFMLSTRISRIFQCRTTLTQNEVPKGIMSHNMLSA